MREHEALVSHVQLRFDSFILRKVVTFNDGINGPLLIVGFTRTRTS